MEGQSVRAHSLVFKMICKYGLTTLHSHYGWLELLPPACILQMHSSILSFFIFTSSRRHDIISNEIRTNLTINFVAQKKRSCLKLDVPHWAVMLFIPLRLKPEEPLLLFWALHSEIHREQHSQRIIFIIQYVVMLYLKITFLPGTFYSSDLFIP